ncbi:hypothetical protein HDZ31DRAFT_38929 [Schizophyllum fasciatum]
MVNASHTDVVLLIWWNKPIERYEASFQSAAIAAKKAVELNGQPLDGARVSVQLQKSSSTRVLVRNLPASVTIKQILTFTGATDISRLPDRAHRTEDTREELVAYLALQGLPVTKVDDLTRPSDNQVKLRLHFENQTVAGRAHLCLQGKTFDWNACRQVFTRLEEPWRYTLPIPTAQFAMQRQQWEALAEAQKACSMMFPRTTIAMTQPFVSIRIAGHDKSVVGQLKVCVEDLVRGESLVVCTSLTDSFLRQAGLQTGALLKRDENDVHAIRIFGEPAAIARARQEVKKKLHRISVVDISFRIESAANGYFVRTGLAALKEELGESNAKLSGPVSRRILTVRGGEPAKVAARRHIEEATKAFRAPGDNADDSCPVCYMEASAPFQLHCGHTYCTTCVKHLLSSALDNKTFPLVCVGDEAKCCLFEAAFTSYVEKNPDKLRHCPTVACEQLYAASDAARTESCPSCFAPVCTSCHNEAHLGKTCAQVQREKEDALTQTLIDEKKYKRCPHCRILVEKVVGCNRILCRCGVTFCWRCVKAFPKAAIYQHMADAHGGIGMGEDVPPEVHAAAERAVPLEVDEQPLEVDMEEQRMLMRQFENARQGAAPQAARAPQAAPRAVEALRRQREAEMQRQQEADAQREAEERARLEELALRDLQERRRRAKQLREQERERRKADTRRRWDEWRQFMAEKNRPYEEWRQRLRDERAQVYLAELQRRWDEGARRLPDARKTHLDAHRMRDLDAQRLARAAIRKQVSNDDDDELGASCTVM